jgi:hypothetical protein
MGILSLNCNYFCLSALFSIFHIFNIDYSLIKFFLMKKLVLGVFAVWISAGALSAQDRAISQIEAPESEISAAIHPLHPDTMIVAAMRHLELSEQGARIRLSIYTSGDAGANWRQSDYDGVRGSAEGSYFAGDPVLAYDSRGKAYLAHVFWRAEGQRINTALYLAASGDQGRTWSAEMLDSSVDNVIDKPWLAVDVSPNSSYRDAVYLAYVKGIFAGGQPAFEICLTRKDADKTRPEAPPTRVHQGNYRVMQSPSVCVGRQGEVYVSFIGNDGRSTALYVARSEDGGRSFFPERKVADLRMYTLAFQIIPSIINREGLSRLYPCPQLRVDRGDGPYSGRLYLAWTDRETGLTSYGLDVFLSFSHDGGNTWSTPRTVHQDNTPNRHQFYPAVAVNSSGALLINWYDRRADPQNRLTHYYFAVSHDGGERFVEETQLSSAPTDFTRVGTRNNNFGVGEYNELVASEDTVVCFWADGRENNGRLRVFFRRLTLRGTTSIAGTPVSAFQFVEFFPNPARERGTLRFTAVEGGRYRLRILAANGVAAAVHEQTWPAGEHIWHVALAHLPSGQYWCRLEKEGAFIARPFTIGR